MSTAVQLRYWRDSGFSDYVGTNWQHNQWQSGCLSLSRHTFLWFLGYSGDLFQQWLYSVLWPFWQEGRCSFYWIIRNQVRKITRCMAYIDGIVPKGPYLPCVSMVGRALLARYHRPLKGQKVHPSHRNVDDLEACFYCLVPTKQPFDPYSALFR